ncbi:MAG TPA: stage III sporulation protein AE [Bacillota bacterium]
MKTHGWAVVIVLGILLALPAAAAGQADAPAAAGPSEAGDAAPAGALPPELAEIVERQWENLETGRILEFVRELNRESEGRLPPLDWDAVTGIVRGEGFPYSARDVLGAVVHALFGAIVDNIGLLGRLVLLAVLLAVLHLLQSAFERETVASAAYTVVYLAMITVALVAFYEAVSVAREVVDSLVGFMQAILPLLITLLAGVGAVVSAGLLSPLAVILVNGVGMIVADAVLPLIFLGSVLDVADHLPGRVRVGRLAAFIRHSGMIVLSLSLTVFLGVMAVQGAAGSVADGVLLRTAKFTAGTFIPVLGGMFADAAELVFGSSLLLKNAVGLLGAVMVLLLAVFPLLKVVALILTFRLAAALVQPISEGPFVDALATMADGLVQIGLATGAVTLMFFLMLTVVLGAGSAAVMLR